MNKTELVWRERTSELDCIASVWTCNASEVTSRTVLADQTKADLAEYYQDDIKKYVKVELPRYAKELEDVEAQKKRLKDSIVSEEKFIKLMENVVNYIGEVQDLEQLDEILGKFYSNFIITNHSVSVITFNTEWYNALNPAWLGIECLVKTSNRGDDEKLTSMRLTNYSSKTTVTTRSHLYDGSNTLSFQASSFGTDNLITSQLYNEQTFPKEPRRRSI